MTEMTITIIIGLLVPLLGTMLGSAFVLFMKDEIIPYGATKSYKEIAQCIGKPKAVRAVAGAIGANGISILIPCHRVIGSNRSLTGYAGGLVAKRMLLGMETTGHKC